MTSTCCIYNQSVSSRHFCVQLFWFQLNVRKDHTGPKCFLKKKPINPQRSLLDDSSSFKLTSHYLGQVKAMQKTHYLTNSKLTISTPYSISFLLFILHHYRSLTRVNDILSHGLGWGVGGGGVELNKKCCTELTILLKMNFLSFCSHNKYVLPTLSQIAALSVSDPFKPVSC